MSGIAGAVALHPGTHPDIDAVSRVVDALQGRNWGPRRMAGDHHAVLAQRLPCVPERPAALQPVVDIDSGLSAVLDGALVNRPALLRELGVDRLDGEMSDARLLLAAYRRWGDAFVARLDGSFALALVDHRERRVLLARDALGTRPLYLAERQGNLLFASSLPALLAAGGIDTTVDQIALRHFLTRSSVPPAPHTILAGVAKLPAATLRTVHGEGAVRDHQYWQPRDGAPPLPEHEWRDAVAEALARSVRRRLPCSGPVSVLLTGGVDSGALVALLTEHHLGPVHTFSIGIDAAARSDDLTLAGILARRFGTRHRARQVPADDLPDAVRQAIADMPEPTGSSQAPLLHMAARHLPDRGAVWLSHGADEVFAGHPSLSRVDDGVVHADAMARPWGLDPLLPYLDRDLVSLAANRPAGATPGLGVLRALGSELLPCDLPRRPHGGFPVPTLTADDGPLGDLVRTTLRSGAAQERGLLDPFTVEQLLAAPERRVPRGGSAVWPLAVLELWLQHHVG